MYDDSRAFAFAGLFWGASFWTVRVDSIIVGDVAESDPFI
jgi:hypothetical protein